MVKTVAPVRSSPSRWWLAVLAAAVLLAGAFAAGSWWQRNSSNAGNHGDPAAALAAAGFDGKQRNAIEAVVRSYLLAHPEILPEAMQRLESRSAAQRIAALRGDLERPFPGAVLGNPAGRVTLVEFTDFACTFCKASVRELAVLTKAHPDLRVVIRELPILSPASEQAARMALAAARQGRYAAFHQAMFASAPVDERSIAAAAASAGLDLAEARRVADSGEIAGELRRNLAFAGRLGIQGTPAWVVGDRLLSGAVGRDRLEQAIDEARRRG